MEKLKQWWHTFWKPKVTTDDLSALRKEIIDLIRAEFTALERSNPLAEDTVKYDMYFNAALSGLLARAGTIGGPENNYAIITWAHQHADFLMKAGKP